MKYAVTCAPPNSMFFLEDMAGGKSPEIDGMLETPNNILQVSTSERKCCSAGQSPDI